MKHKIVFLPHCENCGALITGNVYARYNPYFRQHYVRPCICENCGTYLESIVLPVGYRQGFDFYWDNDYAEMGVSEDE